MTEDEFRSSVREATQDIAPELVDIAIEHTLGISQRIDRDDFWLTVNFARRFGALMSGASDSKAEAKSGSNSKVRLASPDTLVCSMLLAAQIKPDVQALRLRLFETSEPPFTDYNDAVDWIEQECEEGKIEHSPEDSARYEREFREELNEFADRWGAVLGFRYDIQPKRPGIMFANLRRNRAYRRPYNSQSKIGPLHCFAEQTSTKTGFSEQSLVAYVLSGIESIIPEMSLSFRSSLPFLKQIEQATVVIRKPNICENDFRRAYASLKEATTIRDSANQVVGKSRASLLKDKDVVIIRAIRKLGGIPPKGKGRNDFWSRMVEELKSQGIDDIGPHGVRKRVARLTDKEIGDDLVALLYADVKNAVECR